MDGNLNRNLKRVVNRLNTQENDKNCPVKNKISAQKREIMDTSDSDTNFFVVSERNVETIENSKPIIVDSSKTGNCYEITC